ncbi:MAG: glycerophosphodiester phosphodiesterase family protein [Lachnospiraceae bacterium]|nr:glycerophosphodiester phosphodiesterase family protein [Lachnospiraceae bacterium]
MDNRIKREHTKKGTLIAAHRGVAGGNIPFNTISAFEAALIQGADILETDVIKSVDGEIFIFHVRHEKNHLNRNINLCGMTSDEIKMERYVNYDNNITDCAIPTLTQVLEQFKDRCLINLDHIWEGCFKETVDIVRYHNMVDQIIIKTPPKIQYLKMVEELAPDFMYMPIIKEKDEISEIIESMDINFVGAELVFACDSSPVIQLEQIEKYIAKGLILWGNAILYDYKVPLSADHTDDIAVQGEFDTGWGWFPDNGFHIIQTDWPMMLKQYLSKRN